MGASGFVSCPRVRKEARIHVVGDEGIVCDLEVGSRTGKAFFSEAREVRDARMEKTKTTAEANYLLLIL